MLSAGVSAVVPAAAALAAATLANQTARSHILAPRVLAFVSDSAGVDPKGSPRGSSEARTSALDLLVALTADGRHLCGLDYTLPPLLLSWLELARDSLGESTADEAWVVRLIAFVARLVKYNNIVFRAEAEVSPLVKSVCAIANVTDSAEVVGGCLDALDVLVRYGTVPMTCMPDYTAALCRIVNINVFATHSWEVMQSMLKSYLGQTAMYALQSLVGDVEPGFPDADIGLIRGALFFISMASWGKQRVLTAHVSYVVILPAIAHAMSVLCEPNHNIIAYEIALSMHRLIKKYGHQLRIEWPFILDILGGLDPFLDYTGKTSLRDTVVQCLHMLHRLLEASKFHGETNKLITVLESYAALQPAVDVLAVMRLRMASHHFQPGSPTWLDDLGAFTSLFVHDLRVAVRSKLLDILIEVYSATFTAHDLVELLNTVIVPALGVLLVDADTGIGTAALNFAVTQAASPTIPLACTQALISLMASVAAAGVVPEAVSGLVTVLGDHVTNGETKSGLMVVDVMLGMLSPSHAAPALAPLRLEILTCLLSLSSNAAYELMWLNTRCPQFTVSATRSRDTGAVLFPMSAVYDVLLDLVASETDQALFSTALSGLINWLENKFVCVSVDVAKLAVFLSDALVRGSLVSSVVLHGPPSAVASRTKSLLRTALQALILLMGYKDRLAEPVASGLVATVVHLLTGEPATRNPALRAFTIAAAEFPVEVAVHLRRVIYLLFRSHSNDASAFSETLVLDLFWSLTHYRLLIKAMRHKDVVRVLTILAHIGDTSPLKYCMAFAHRTIAAWFHVLNVTDRVRYLPFFMHKFGRAIAAAAGDGPASMFRRSPQSARAAGSALVPIPRSPPPRSYDSDSPDSSIPPRLVHPRRLSGSRSATSPPVLSPASSAVAAAAAANIATASRRKSRKSGSGRSGSRNSRGASDTGGSSGDGTKSSGRASPAPTRMSSSIRASPTPDLGDLALVDAAMESRAALLVMDMLLRATHGSLEPFPGSSVALSRNRSSGPPSAFRAWLGDDTTTTSWLHGTAILTVTVGATRWSHIMLRRPTGTFAWLLKLESEVLDTLGMDAPPPPPRSTSSGGLLGGELPGSSSSLVPSLSAPDMGVLAESSIRASRVMPGSVTPPMAASPSDGSFVTKAIVLQLMDELRADVPDYKDGVGAHANGREVETRSRELAYEHDYPTMPGAEQMGKSEISSLPVVGRVKQRPPPPRRNKPASQSEESIYSRMMPLPAYGGDDDKGEAGELKPSPAFMGESHSLGVGSVTTARSPVAISSSVSSNQSWHGGGSASSLLSLDEQMKLHASRAGGASAIRKTPVQSPSSTSTPHPPSMKSAVGAEPRVADADHDIDDEDDDDEDDDDDDDAVIDKIMMQAGAGGVAAFMAADDTSLADVVTEDGMSLLSRSYSLPDIVQSGTGVMGPWEDLRHPELGLGSSSGWGTPEHGSAPHSPRAGSSRSRSNSRATPGRHASSGLEGEAVWPEAELGGGGSFPHFLFSQLREGLPGMDAPSMIRLPDSEAMQRALGLLDLVPTVNTHKIGLLYVAPGQFREADILGNTTGSTRYMRFLQSLGSFMSLRGAIAYTGGLDRSDESIDGETALYWKDELSFVVFHTTTLMPNMGGAYSQFQNKKRHIGNDYVTIVFNESEHPFTASTIPGQFNFVHIVISPLESEYLVLVKVKPGMEHLARDTGTHLILTEPVLAMLVRQIAIRADLFAQIFHHGTRFVSNWEERLKQICLLCERAASASPPSSARGPTSPYSSTDWASRG
ncbi:GARNL1 protein [Thecamonas trahens ATCC 50062]|uniref:GARNL1 protein n=1 Tax=Thecamonas trahens ATCC 50062 TaxID=461836 RepID=A0A0L0D7F5_THETB|nr:GARNL1 protein [Thecamonas trahens ATCC 50062]KNC48016.1 GARNL1 protein [Thecamonas trahens ATCC 50062]|eukprot:XP_013759031.1 GARNL1 protein [Thecamonas trahens ATCC 50062]